MKTETTKMNAAVNSTADSPNSTALRVNRHRRREVRARSSAWRGCGRDRAERGERPVLVRAEVHHAADGQQAPVGDRRACPRGHEREQADAGQQARAPGEVESAPPPPGAGPGAGDTPPPGQATVGHEVELQGGDGLESVRDPGGASERDQRLQQPVAGEGYRTPDQREQPLLPTPKSRTDASEQ